MLSVIVFYGMAAIVGLAIMTAAIAAPVIAYNNVRRLDRVMPLIVTGLACGLLILGGVLNTRNLQYASFGAAFIESEGSMEYFWSSRIVSLILLGLSVPYLLAKFMIFIRDRQKLNWPVIVTVIFAVTSYVLPAILGTKPGFDHRLMYPILVLVVLLVADPRLVDVISLIKWSLTIFFILSLLFILVDQNRVLAPGFEGFIPGFSSRFWGLASHANAIGPMAATCLLLELFIPARKWYLRGLIITMSIAVLVLSQSKTTIIAVTLGLLAMFYLRYAYQSRISGILIAVKPHWGQIALFLAAFALAFGLLMGSFFGVLDGMVSKFTSSKIASDAQTLTGRDVIWRVAIDEWRHNPWFGYGSSLWNLDYRMHVGLNYAFHAHNQFVQALAESGLFGLFGLVLLFASLTISAIKTRVITLGASFALLLLLFTRSITEVPLRPSGLGTGEMLLMIAIIMIWRIAYLPEERARRALSATA